MDSQQQNDEQPAKVGGDPGAIDHVKSITNINYNCLEQIFEFLDLENLFNVANTCKRLQIAAAAFYGDVYGKGTVRLWIQYAYLWRAAGIKYFDGNKPLTNVCDVELCLPFLRCFGSKILSLDVYYDDRLTVNNQIDRYINQYCAKALKRISFMFSWEFSIANFPNPFECVEEVRMITLKLKEQLPYFVNLFPKLRRLEMSGVSVEGNRVVAVHFPNLEKLTIAFRGEGFTMKNLEDLLHANPLLQKLKLYMREEQLIITMKELLNTISQNQSITNLGVWLFSVTNVNSADLMRFARERPLTVTLELMGPKIPPQDAINFIRQLKSLKSFRFLFSGHTTDYDQLVSQLDSEWNHERGTCLNRTQHYIRLKR